MKKLVALAGALTLLAACSPDDRTHDTESADGQTAPFEAQGSDASGSDDAGAGMLVSKDGFKLTPVAEGLAYESPRGTVEVHGRHLRQQVFLAVADGVAWNVVQQL